MARLSSQRFEDLRVNELLLQQPGLRLRPVVKGELRIVGSFAFSFDPPGRELISDRYEIALSVPPGFPRVAATVRETGGRIPKNFHTNRDDTLCLGSPTRLRLELLRSPTLPGFVASCLVPYLYAFSYREKHGELPFGELPHGAQGLRQDFAELLDVKSDAAAVELVRLASLKKRVANKKPCPCGSRRRLGRCHHLEVNKMRHELGRTWLRTEHQTLM